MADTVRGAWLGRSLGAVLGSALLAWSSTALAQTLPPVPATAPAASPQAATSVAAPAVQPAPAAARRPPFPNRANDALPAWLRVRGEFRERFEGFSNAGFVGGREDAYALSRFRFNATVTPSPVLSFQVQAQDARVADKTIGPTGAPFKGTFDLRMAFADIGSAKGPVVVRVGRQELVYGEQRLLGHVSWLNTARTFDGVKAMVKGKKISVDAFATSLVRIMDREFDKSGNGNMFLGAYASTGAVVPKSTLEPYAFFRGDRNIRTETGTTGGLRVVTLGARWVGRLPAGLDYGIEMAAQTGSVGSDTVRAWGGHWQLRETFPVRTKVVLTAEYNYGSGDQDPADGTRGTFDQLYPTPHDKYGLADQFGWKNLHHVRAGFDITPVKGWPVTTNYHTWWLAEARDGLYAASSALFLRAPAGAAVNRHIGHEIDVQIARTITPQLQVAGGYAHIFTGPFLKQVTPGKSYSAPYVMATYVFLADK
jgi:hypothetical protein